jgi:hypothetical protein
MEMTGEEFDVCFSLRNFPFPFSFFTIFPFLH